MEKANGVRPLNNSCFIGVVARENETAEIPRLRAVKSVRPGEFSIAIDPKTSLVDNDLMEFCLENDSDNNFISIGFNKNEWAIKVVFDKGLQVLFDDNKNVVDVALNGSGKSLVNGLRVDMSKAEVFTILGGSPSQDREKDCIMLNLSIHPLKLTDLLNKMTSGGLQKLFIDGQKIPTSEFVKLRSRLFLSNAPHTKLGELDTIAIYFGKFGKGNMDGQYFISNEVLKTIYEHRGFLPEFIPETFGIGKKFQGREWKTIKGVSEVMSPKHMDLACVRLDCDGDPMRFAKATQDLQDLLNEAFEGNELKSKVVVIGPKKTPDILVDLNALKTMPNLIDCSKSTLNIVNIPNRSVAHTCWQVLDKLIFASPNAVGKWAVDFQNRKIEEAIEMAMDFESRIVAPINVMPRELIRSMAPRYVQHVDKALYIKKLKDIVQTLKRNINRFHWEIAGGFYFIAADHAIIAGSNVLTANEVFCKDLSSRQIEQVFITKLPATDLKEIGMYDVVSIKEIKNRIKQLDVDSETSEYLMTRFMVTDKHVLIMPAHCEIMNKHAGSDYDGDGVIAIDVKSIEGIEFSKEMFNAIIDIKKASPSKEMIKTGLSQIGMGSVLNIDNKNKGVGAITNMFRMITSLLMKSPKVQSDVLKFHGYIPGFNKYVPIEGKVIEVLGSEFIKYNVSEEDGKRIAHAINDVSWSPENLRSILIDLSKIGRSVQERTIDSPKTGENVEMHFELNKMKISGLVFGELVLDPDENDPNKLICYWDHQKFEDRPSNQNMGGKSMPIFAIEDWSGMLIKKGLEKAACLINEQLLKVPAYSDEDFQILNNMDDISDKDYASLSQAIFTMKLYYNNICAYRGLLLDELGSQKNKISVVKASIDPLYKAIGNTIRLLTVANGMSDDDMARMVKRSAMVGKGNQYRADGGTMFAETVIPEEYSKFVIKHYGDLDILGSMVKHTCTEIVNDESISFVKGLCPERGIILKDKVNGEFIMQEIEGKWYATQDIEIALPSPEISGTIFLKLSDKFKEKINELKIREEYPINNGMFIGTLRLDLCKQDEALVDLITGTTVRLDGIHNIISSDGKNEYVYLTLFIVGQNDVNHSSIIDDYDEMYQDYDDSNVIYGFDD